MTITSEPQTGVTPDPAMDTLALCAYMFGPEQGSHLLRRALHAAILARQGVDPRVALELAQYGCDWFTLKAGDEKDRLIREAERAVLAAEQDGQVAQ